MKRTGIHLLLVSLIFLSACKKEDKPAAAPAIAAAKGMYILSEGNFGNNNTKLSYRDALTGIVTGDFFLQQNPSHPGGLGDSGNDMVIYGSKMYVVMNVTSNVTVLRASDGVFISQVPFVSGSVNKEPRYAVAARGKLYVSAFDGTVSIIDTSSLTITNTIQVGPNPEGLAIVGNYLYVANSGGFNPVADSTVSVVDLNTNLEIKKITVGLNPQRVEANTRGDVYVSGYGNAFAPVPVPPFVSVINATNNTLKEKLGAEFAFDHIRLNKDTAFLFNNYGGGNCVLLNTVDNSIIRNNFITDGTLIQTYYGVNVDEQNGDVYIADAGNFSSAGTVTCFGTNGKKKFSFSVAPGVSPNKTIFVR